MKKETRKKLVNYDVFIADDGKEFNNKKECRQYERLKNGEIKECPDCKGTGKILVEEHDENYHTGAPETYICHVTCKKCNGKGYLEKKIKVCWE